MPSKHRSIVLVCALAALLSACSGSPKAGVKMASVSTDLGLGIQPSVLPAQYVQPLPQLDLPQKPNLTPPPPPPPAMACPTAGLLTFPDQAATPTLQGRPTPGDYNWKYQIDVIDPGRAQQYLSGSWLDAAKQYGNKLFFGTHEVGQPGNDIIDTTIGGTEVGGQTVATGAGVGSFDFSNTAVPGFGPGLDALWRQDEIRVQPTPYGPTHPAPAVPGTNIGTTDPGANISLLLTSWATGATRAQTVWTTANAPLLELMEFPVVPSTTIHSATNLEGIDLAFVASAAGGSPTTSVKPGPTFNISLNGTVMGHHWLDACGSIVDSMLVHSVMSITGQNQTPLVMDYDYGIATQMGGLPVYERIAIPSGSRPAVIITSSIGTIHPRPLQQ